MRDQIQGQGHRNGFFYERHYDVKRAARSVYRLDGQEVRVTAREPDVPYDHASGLVWMFGV